MTLDKVAAQTELTTGFISQVERGISSPSLSSLMGIAAALQTNVEQLISVPEKYSEYIHKDRRQSYALGIAGRFYEKLGPGFPGSLIHSQIIRRPAGHESEKMCHDGEVFCYLLYNPVDLAKGMVMSIEPGHYVADSYGIRIENLFEIVEEEDGFLAFRNLTWVPIQTDMLIKDALTRKERDWLTGYHSETEQKLRPFLTDQAKNWCRSNSAAFT